MELSFLNRTSELKQIQQAVQKQEPSLIILYGRRRCGKSRLLNQLPKDQIVYHLADLSEPALQRAYLAEDINRHIPGFSDVVYPTWQALLSSFFARLPEKPMITLVLDEFPYLAQLDPSLPSVIQKLYDTEKFRSHVIVCGSSQRMMYGLVIDSSAPLYGRASEILKIRPLQPGWIRQALGLEGPEAIEAYAVWGGVPRYWESAREYPSYWEAAVELAMKRNGLFHQEPHRLLMDEMRSDVQPHSLLSIIAGGCNRLSEIAARLGKKAVSLTRPLNLLIELGYIHREIPFGESIRSTKRTLYRLSDPFLLFWYRYIHPWRSLLEQDVIEPVVQKWEDTRGHHVGEIWEQLARLSVPRIPIAGIQWKQAHRWWGKTIDGSPAEIDIVAESIDQKSILLGEVKWSEDISVDGQYQRLRALAPTLPFTKDKKVCYALWLPQKNVPHGFPCHIIDADMVLDALV
ncbi:MAG: ATP-binding protein [Chitinispirillaceae bacterium]